MKKYIVNSLGHATEVIDEPLTAYELADAIEDWDSDGQWDTPAAVMLRKQADTIKLLEEECAALRKQLNELLD